MEEKYLKIDTLLQHNLKKTSKSLQMLEIFAASKNL